MNRNRVRKQELVKLTGKAFANAGKLIMARVPLQTYKLFQCLNPRNILEEQTLEQITELAEKFPHPDSLDVDNVEREFRTLLAEDIDWQVYIEEANVARVDDLWMYILRNRELPQLTLFIKTMLIVSHGQADVERNFSKSGKLMTFDKGRVRPKTLRGVLHIADAIKTARDGNLLINQELISVAAHARTINRLSV